MRVMSMFPKACLFALASSVTLTACNGGDDRSSEALPESVEMPAQEALEAIAEEPVADPDAMGESAAEAEPVAEAEVGTPLDEDAAAQSGDASPSISEEGQ